MANDADSEDDAELSAFSGDAQPAVQNVDYERGVAGGAGEKRSVRFVDAEMVDMGAGDLGASDGAHDGANPDFEHGTATEYNANQFNMF